MQDLFNNYDAHGLSVVFPCKMSSLLQSDKKLKQK